MPARTPVTLTIAMIVVALLLSGCSTTPADVDGVVGPVADGVAQLREDLLNLDEGRANVGAWREPALFGRIADITLREALSASVDAARTVPAEDRRGLLITAAADLPEPDRDLVVAMADVHVAYAHGQGDLAIENRLTDAFVDFVLAIADADPDLRALLIQVHNDRGYSPAMPDDLTGGAFLAADHPHVDNMALAASQEVSQQIGRTHAASN